jgi:hypothetical protein
MTGSRESDQRKLRWLWISAAAYFVLVLIGLQYASAVPYQLLALAAGPNFAIMFAFIFAIRRVYLRTRTATSVDDTAASEDAQNSRRKLDRRRVPLLWAGAIGYFLACLNGLRFVRQIPFPILIAVSILNVGIAVVFVLEIKRTYGRLRQ